jgi:glycosyltransferase involved in cell wall biosynthesis
VTTVIPAYNASGFIRRALDSALAQNCGGSEIIVVDDGSTDDTAAVVSDYFNRGVRLIRHRTNLGASAARNIGIAAARGEFIAFLDADDEWLPDKLELQLSVLASNDSMVLVSCLATILDEDGCDRDLFHGAPPPVGKYAWQSFLARPCVATPSVVARRAALLAVGGFNKWLPFAEDQDLWIRLSSVGEVGTVLKTLVRVHRRSNSLSRASIRDQGEVLLPLIIGHVARHGMRLTDSETQRILGERYSRTGRLAYSNGEVRYGLATLLRAVGYGYDPLGNLIYLIRASSMARKLKRYALAAYRATGLPIKAV